MRFPATSAPQYFFLDAGRKFVQLNQFTYPTLQALSVVNRATGNAVIQSTGSLQPTWSGNALQGPYSYINNPGVLGSTPAGIGGFTFAGAAYFEQDSVATSAAGSAEAALTVVCTVNAASSGGVVWSFADATTDGYLYLSYGSGAFSFTEENTHGTFTASATVTAATTHVVTCTRAGGNLVMRVDQAAGSPVAVTAGAETYTTFCVGALNSNATIVKQFNGVIGHLAVYGGSADIDEVEVFLLQAAGIILGPTSGTNTGF